MYGHSLVPMVQPMLQSLHGILVPITEQAQDAGYFPFQLTLYESFGMLVGQNPDDVLQPQQVEALLGPVAAKLQQLAGAPNAAALGMTQMHMCLMVRMMLSSFVLLF